MAKIITVHGMNGSGKSTFSANLANEIANNDNVVILVNAETNFGTIQIFFGEEISDDKGLLNALIDKTENPEKFLVQTKKNKNLYLLSIPNTIGTVNIDGIEKEKLDSIFKQLAKKSDYIIVDATSDFYNGITLYSLLMADVVVTLHRLSISDIFYTKMSTKIKKQLASKAKMLNIVSMHNRGLEPKIFENALDIEINEYIEDSSEASELENAGKLIVNSDDRYKKMVHNIMKII